MRPSRSGSARGLRSGGSPSEQASASSRSRSAGGSSPRASTKRRGRTLPLTKGAKGSSKDEGGEKSPKPALKAENEAELVVSLNQEETGAAKDPPADPQAPPKEDQEAEENPHQPLSHRLQATQDGKVITIAVTVHGAIIDKNYDITRGLGQDGNQFFCEICKGFGNVVCCDGCPKVYHTLCIPKGDPARKALDNDEDPWFCPECLDRGVTEKADTKPAAEPRPTPDEINSTENDKRSSSRAVKRKCNECQNSGGDMIPCAGCGSYIHDPPCRTDEDSNDGTLNICSNCRVEAVVEQEEEDQDQPEEANDDTSNSQEPPGTADRGGRVLRKRSIGNEKEAEAEADASSEEMSPGEEEEEEEEAEAEAEEEQDVAMGVEATPIKQSRKRAHSTTSDMPSTKKKKKMPSSDRKKRKHSDKKKKKKKKKARLEREAEDINGQEDDMYASPGGRLTHRGLVQATPAFFFFLNDSKLKIERVLARKHRYFNRLPKGMERNELIAREGAHWWVKLRLTEQQRYFSMSMRDFEAKVVEWKEEKTIREMMAARDAEDGYNGGILDYDEDGQDLSPEDELTMYKRHQRLYLTTSVGSKPFTPEAGKSNNRVLLELLQDMRFHPLQMFNPRRTDGDCGLMNRSKISIPYFEVRGPVATSVGDECSGCTRGWNHFCPVLKRRVPAIENRARLQPPMSSLMATRVGLGLKTKIPEVIDQPLGREAPLFESRTTHEAEQAKRVPAIPSFTLDNPMNRADDVVCFVEECLAMKVPEPPRPALPNMRAEPTKKKSILSRGALPMRGRRKSNEFDTASSNEAKEESSKSLLNKCGRCRTIIESDTGCIQCRRAQLVINTSKRGPGVVQNPLTGKEKKREGVKVQTTMIGRLTVKDSNFDEQDESDRAVANAIIKLRWMPCAILPPQKAYVPTPNSDSEKTGEEESDEDAEAASDSKADEVKMDQEEGKLSADVVDDVKSEVPHENGGDEAKPPSKDNTDGTDKQGGSRSSRLRSRSSRAQSTVASTTEAGQDMDVDMKPDRQELAKKHRDEATELARRCLHVACCGIFLAMVRRDPLCLFAEPVPSNVVGYSQVVLTPIDFAKIKSRVLREKYSSLGAFIQDARLLCTNALAFNPPGSIYSKTAKELNDVLDVMHKRASKWITLMKEAHASSFTMKGMDASSYEEDTDTFKELRKTWPEAVEMLENGDWLREQVASDFTRTKENESAYYGSIAIRRAAAAAEASLAPYTDSGGIHSTVVRRSHAEDESLRHVVNAKASKLTAPIQLKDIPRWREESVLRTLRRVQSRRVEGRIMSENGCARCDEFRAEAKMAMAAIRWGRNKRKGEIETIARVADSRLSLTTGLASMKSRERIGRELDGSELIVKTDKKEEEEEEEEKRENDAEKELEKAVEAVKMETEATEAGAESANKNSAKESAVDNWDKVNDVAVNVRGSGIHGWGLFADQPFQRGEIVAEYIGEYIVNAVADLREKMYQERRIQDYQFRVDEHLVIDATLKGGHGRYINHNCNPNCIAKIVDGKPPDKHLKRVIIIAQRDIKAREEITYDYQFPLELDLEARIPCNCGSLLCRGFMNWDLPEKGSKNRVLRTQKRGGNMRDRIRRLGRPLKKQEQEGE